MVNNDYGSFCCRRLCYEFSFVAENRLCKTSVDGRFGFQMAEHDILRGDRNRKSKEPKGDSHLIFSGKPGEAKFNTGMDTNRPKGLVCVLSRTGECGESCLEHSWRGHSHPPGTLTVVDGMAPSRHTAPGQF